ncbi:AraC family transcriptional regulator [Flavipsychrobacter stenotrophus]|uniref:AraC family transcriptional regulator n=1 Tax=Flavipsychrobacter stenotrophus TaxID=2077091 RepID=A0A2S7T0V3_9BACT|nr:helix-turn-helix transcriptional regulator [Flavipsychrobacter stenotrophus]PQJ12820.1 AraC family transcriptional regulator [Flavipsychrobacter stenotrophus]
MKQKVKNTIPVYDICSLHDADNNHKDVIAQPFAEYLKIHPNLHSSHRHTFYHLLLFIKGGGYHTIDFERFPVNVGQVYFMIPGQVHSWNFEGDIDGYVINFSEDIFRNFLLKQDYLEQFSFFGGIAKDSVINLPQQIATTVSGLFADIISDINVSDSYHADILCARLIEVFITVSRNSPINHKHVPIQNQLILFNFRKLLNTYFAEKRLPKEYAEMLYITPNHLNALCNDLLGIPAGELIRDRVLLEAKRLLVNVDVSISEIAYQLNFADNSYFSKFFKKYAGVTPEDFRKSFK